MYAACPSSVVSGAALKILRCAQDDRSEVGAWNFGAVPDGGVQGATEWGLIKTMARFTSQSSLDDSSPQGEP